MANFKKYYADTPSDIFPPSASHLRCCAPQFAVLAHGDSVNMMAFTELFMYATRSCNLCSVRRTICLLWNFVTSLLCGTAERGHHKVERGIPVEQQSHDPDKTSLALASTWHDQPGMPIKMWRIYQN